MASCISTINKVNPEILYPNQIYISDINTTSNSLYILNCNMVQSIFLSFNILESDTNNVSCSVSVYNKESLSIVGSITISSFSVNTSFTLGKGDYYICIRSIIGKYKIKLIPDFISYSTKSNIQGESYFGYYVPVCNLKYTAREGTGSGKDNMFCTREIVYEIIDGNLPKGLKMSSGGYITGFIPLLDSDEYNNDFPTSSSWYYKKPGYEYYSNYGRVYRFKVKLTLKDDKSKEDIKWYYIIIVNNYSKNIAKILKFKEDTNTDLATFEIDTQNYLYNLCNNTNKEDNKYDNTLYNNIIKNSPIDNSESDIIVYERNEDLTYYSDNYTEDIVVSEISYDSDNNPRFINKYRKSDLDLINYFKSNFESDISFISRLKSSLLFNDFLYQNNMRDYANTDFINIADVNDIKISFYTSDSINYVRLIGKLNNINNDLTDSSNLIENMHNEDISKLPIFGETLFGYNSTSFILRSNE